MRPLALDVVVEANADIFRVSGAVNYLVRRGSDKNGIRGKCCRDECISLLGSCRGIDQLAAGMNWRNLCLDVLLRINVCVEIERKAKRIFIAVMDTLLSYASP